MSVFQRTNFLIPQNKYLDKWPVIACDQFTSQPEYWQKLSQKVGHSPSALHIIYPEAELGHDEEKRIETIDRTMSEYLSSDVFRTVTDSYVYVERKLDDGSVRKGLVGAVDLEAYDYRDDAKTPIRASEKTVVSRIPPRVKIRSGAPIESSHVILLCADRERDLIEGVERGEKIYDLDLMQGGGHLTGWLVSGELADFFDLKLAKYVTKNKEGLCFAVGDGNHSLAAAKTCWENLKRADPALQGSNHPARWAMVELENLFDPVQRFEPIHRIIHTHEPDLLIRTLEECDLGCGIPVHWNYQGRSGCIRFGENRLPVDSLQSFLDAFVMENGGTIDYIHGDKVAIELSREYGTISFLLPGIEKDELFHTISKNGSLPRKTFSIGHAEEKRYYLECRKILP